jgi:hypothetical protein
MNNFPSLGWKCKEFNSVEQADEWILASNNKLTFKDIQHTRIIPTPPYTPKWADNLYLQKQLSIPLTIID